MYKVSIPALTAIASFLSFIIVLFAAVWAVELYRLLKTGEIGKTWRVLIVATLVFAVHEILAMAETFGYIERTLATDLTDLVFVFLLAYACYLQRRAFFTPHLYRHDRSSRKRAFPSRYDRLRDDMGLGEADVVDEEEYAQSLEER